MEGEVNAAPSLTSKLVAALLALKLVCSLTLLSKTSLLFYFNEAL